MILKYSFSIKKIITATVFSLFLAIGVSEAKPIQVQGKLPTQNRANGYYDLQIQIYGGGKQNPRLLQTIQMAKVSIHNGEFKISLETSIDLSIEKDLSFHVQSREFETGEAFQPAETTILAKN